MEKFFSGLLMFIAIIVVLSVASKATSWFRDGNEVVSLADSSLVTSLSERENLWPRGQLETV